MEGGGSLRRARATPSGIARSPRQARGEELTSQLPQQQEELPPGGQGSGAGGDALVGGCAVLSPRLLICWGLRGANLRVVLDSCLQCEYGGQRVFVV